MAPENSRVPWPGASGAAPGRPPGSYRFRSARPGSEKELGKNFKRFSSWDGSWEGNSLPTWLSGPHLRAGEETGKSPEDVGQKERLARLLGEARAVPRLLGRLGKLSEE